MRVFFGAGVQLCLAPKKDECASKTRDPLLFVEGTLRPYKTRGFTGICSLPSPPTTLPSRLSKHCTPLKNPSKNKGFSPFRIDSYKNAPSVAKN